MKKKLYYVIALFLTVVGLTTTSCSDDIADLGDLPIVEESLFSISVDSENGNLVHFLFKGEKMSPYWEINLSGNMFTSSEREFNLTLNRGVYEGTLAVYNRDGLSEKFPFSFEITAVDPALLPLFGENDDKVWVWDMYAETVNGGSLDQGGNRIFGYVWGSPWQNNCWFYGIDDFADMKNMDDELQFHADGSFALDAKGTVWVDGGAFADVENGGVATWSAAGTETWTVFEDGGRRYIQFAGGGFPSIVASPEAVNGLYELAELTENSLRLRFWNSDADYTEYNFIPKGYVPEDRPDDPIVNPEPEFPEGVSALPDDSEQIGIITAKTWKLWTKYGYYYGDENLYVSPAVAKDDRITFYKDHKLTINTGETSQTYTDDGMANFSANGTEGWQLGQDATGKCYLMFTGGGFPIIRPNLPGTNLVYEVAAISKDELKLYWSYGDGGYFVTILVPEDAEEEPDTPDMPSGEDLAIDSYECKTLTAHSWKLDSKYGYNYGSDDLYDLPVICADDVITFHNDFSLTIDTGDSKQIYTDDGIAEYQISGDEGWKLTKADDNAVLKLVFTGGGFPLIRPNLPGINLTYEVVEISADRVKLNWSYGDGGYFVTILVPV